MTTPAIFLRLLQHGDKEAALRGIISAMLDGTVCDQSAYLVDPSSFRGVPGSPFSYWVEGRLRRLFSENSPFELGGRTVKQGLATADDFRFVRAWWEVPNRSILDASNGPDWKTNLAAFQQWCRERSFQGKRWAFFAKGGEYSPFYSDLHLVVNWEKNGEEIRSFIDPGTGRTCSRPQNIEHYFRQGITWALRSTSGFGPYVLPAGCIFSHKGPAIFTIPKMELATLGTLFSQLYQRLIEVSLAAGEETQSGTASRSYEVGLIQRLPILDLGEQAGNRLASLTNEIVNGVRLEALSDEPSIWFFRPVAHHNQSLRDTVIDWQRDREDRDVALLKTAARLENEVERLVGGDQPIIEERTTADARSLIALPESDLGGDFDQLYQRSIHETIREELDEGGGNRQIAVKSYYVSRHLEVLSQTLKTHPRQVAKIAKERRLLPEGALYQAVASILSYAVGCILGRWDLRYATGERRVFDLPDSFAPLPVCPPGALQGSDGQPATESPSRYPLWIDWNGILVDDPDHSDDIIHRTRDVLEVIWKDRVDAIEKEACEILGVADLRDYFRKLGAGGFWDDHVKRDSKSRRKAPIYWQLQSSKKNYALWIYYHRLDKDILFKALLNFVEPKIRREESRFNELRSQKTALGPAAKGAKKLDKDIDRQEAFLSELRDFEGKLRRAANLHLDPDLNDGVVLNIAPLRELVPWKEAKSYWDDLMDGKYEWSSIGKQLREKGIVPC